MPELHTFSIAARCSRSGMLGVATASAIPCVGSISTFAAPAIGAIATQAWCNPYLALEGLGLLRGRMSAERCIATLMEQEPCPQLRQLGIVDGAGRSACWTGTDCTAWAGHRLADGVCILGNMLAGETVLTSMEEAFFSHPDRPLADRLIAALRAGEAAGGDRRGKQSTSLLVFDQEDYPLVDIRVDDHASPTDELARIREVAAFQLSPFIGDMPKRHDRSHRASAATGALLALSPADRSSHRAPSGIHNE